MSSNFMITTLLTALSLASSTQAQPTLDTTRGALLYDTHCIACHQSSMHWRDRKIVSNWTSLRSEVRRWQAESKLRWSDADIEAVARYLNGRYYRLPERPVSGKAAVALLGGRPAVDNTHDVTNASDASGR